jgi:hypothetical protein
MLLRVEQKDFKILWEVNKRLQLIDRIKFLFYFKRNKQYLHGVIISLSQLTNTLGNEIDYSRAKKNRIRVLDPKRRTSEFDPSLLPQVGSSKFFKDDPS